MAIPIKTPISCVFKEIKKPTYATENWWLSAIPEEYSKVSIEDCKEIPEGYVKYGIEWAKEYPQKSLYLYGDYGSGKTTYAFGLIRRIIQNIKGTSYFWPKYYTGRQLDSEMLKATKSDEGEEWFINDLSEIDLLFVDDIDKVTGTDRFKAQFFEVINRRLGKQKPTIITSNCEPGTIEKIIDGSIVSRMSDIKKWRMIQFPKKDLRKQQVLTF